jgi:hypothetical protein
MKIVRCLYFYTVAHKYGSCLGFDKSAAFDLQPKIA